MASRDGAVHHNQIKPKEQPARVLLTGPRGGHLNVNIGKITGSVTVGNRNHVTHYHHQEGSRKKGQSSTGYRSSDSESSSSDSESETGRQSFFKSHGVAMPTKNQFKEMRRKMGEMKAQMSGSGSGVHSLVVDKTAGTYALDSRGKSAPIQSQTVLSGFTMNPMGSVNQQQKSNNPPVSQQAGQSADQPTIYQQQTQKIVQITTQLQNKNKIITKTVVHQISLELGKGWRRVFRHLDFSDDVIDRTFGECRQLQETVYRLLLKWTQVAGTPDVEKLVGALVRAEQLHIISLLQG